MSKRLSKREAEYLRDYNWRQVGALLRIAEYLAPDPGCGVEQAQVDDLLRLLRAMREQLEAPVA
jgi:hypothetical protein